MPSTYTLNNGIELIGTGEQSGTWGDTTNTNLQLLDTALDGQVTVALSSAGSSGSPNNLPVSDGTTSNGRNRLVTFSDSSDLGATAYVQLTPNDSEKIIYVRNSLSGSRSIVLFQGTYNASNDYEVPAGTTAVVFFNGAGTGAVAANVFNNAFFDSLRLGGVSVTAILDEDDMSSDSATALATQQSIKKYVDDKAAAQDTLAEVLANGNTTGGTNIVVSVDDVISMDNGTNLLPSLTTTGDLNTGLYFPAADEVGLTVGGTQRLNVSATGIDITGQVDVNSAARIDSSGIVKAANGTEAAPTHSFLNDPDNGMFRPTTNTVGFSTAGSEAMRVDSGQRVLIGTTSAENIATSSKSGLQISSTGALAAASISRFKNSDSGPWLFFGKSRGATVGTNAVVSSGDSLGALRFGGDDGTDIQSYGAEIKVNVDGTPGSNDMPGRLSFWTTADGASSSTERMRIDQAGRVGIKNSSMDLFGAVTGADLFVIGSGAGSQGMTIYSGNSGAGNIAFADGTTTTQEYEGLIQYDHGSNFMDFYSNHARAMRIDSSQRVLINTSSVAVASTTEANVQIATASGIALALRSTATAVGPAAVLALGRQNGTGIVSDDDHIGDIRFASHDGTDLTHESAKIRAAVDGTPGNNDVPGRLEFYTTADGASSSTERMRIDADGVLMVGKTSSSSTTDGCELRDGQSGYTATFTADASNSSEVISVQHHGTQPTKHIILRDTTGNTKGAIGVSTETNSTGMFLGFGDTGLSFQAETDNAITPVSSNDGVTRDAAVDLGDSNARFKDIYLSGDVKVGGGGTGKTGEIQFVADSTRAKIVGGYDSGGGGYIAFRTDTSGGTDLERARFNNAGNLAFTSGNGIDFSATGNGSGSMSNELLDDYEEGTWTPSLKGADGNGGITSYGGTPIGVYTKIGNLVTVSCVIYNTAHTGSGAAHVFGLPFACSSSGEAVGTYQVNTHSTAYASGITQVAAIIQGSNSHIHFRGYHTGTSTGPYYVPMQNFTYLRATITYQTNA